MIPEKSEIEYKRALDDFRRARSKAELQRLWSSITGKSIVLMPYDEISMKISTSGLSSKGLEEISIDSIIGSVNRYQDFNRDFLPLHDEDMQRWANVKAVMTSPGSAGLPPIRVYKLGDVYFVLDGNHRVSIAREMGIETIEAYVTEIRSRLKLTPEDSPEDIILKAEYAHFMDEMQIEGIIPKVELKVSFPGLTAILKEHIQVHRYYMSIEQKREIPLDEALRHWHKHVYLPVVNVIRSQEILQEFPGRTETDLYIWVLDHQTYMAEEYGWSIRPEKAASDLASNYGKRLIRKFNRAGRKLLAFLLPQQLESFSTPGEWHEKKNIEMTSLFSDILVAMSGSAESWLALEQAIIIAQMEHADVRGLVVKGKQSDYGLNEEDLVKAFRDRLDQVGLSGNLVFSKGNISEMICEGARVNDLVIIKYSYPPSPNIISRFKSGINTIVRRCACPVLLVRNRVSPMNRLLVAYDGSPKGREALFVSSYLASHHGKTLTVLVVDEDEKQGQGLLKEAEAFLGDCSKQALFRQSDAPVSETILNVANEVSAELILIGGYGLPPIMEILFGSTVNGILRGTNLPILVCQ